MLLDIEQIKASIKQLTAEELAELGQFIQQAQAESEPVLIRSQLLPQEKLDRLRQLQAWEGLTEAEINEAVEAMTRKIPSEEDPELFAWVKDTP